MNEPQNLANHSKIVPMFHLFLLPVLALNLISSIIWAVRILGRSHGIEGQSRAIEVSVLVSVITSLLVSVGLIVLAFLARVFALGVQDRVIRLEERLRYQQLLPEDLKQRINDFTINQLVALRFASDAELPALARKVLDGNINSRKAIKQMIQTWRADYQRV
jgi:Family of unknown function (DUF6526)